MIDWSSPKNKLSEHFTVHDALWLPSWQVYHTPTEAEQANIIATAAKLELVREYLGKPLVIHCWIRPIQARVPNSLHDYKNYNAAVGGAPGSAHIDGLAVDFNPVSMTCAEARHLLVDKLKDFDIRMENRDGNWVHIDLRQPAPGKPRFFRP